MGVRWLMLLALGLIAPACGGDDAATTGDGGDGKTAVYADPGESPTDPVEDVAGVQLRPPKATVLVSGETQRGDGFEFVLVGSSKGPCVAVAYPQRRGATRGGGGSCGDLFDGPTRPISALGSGDSRDEPYVYGYASEDVASVNISPRDGSEVEASVAPIPAAAAKQAGFRRGLSFFAAFLPIGSSAADARAEAFDDQGNSLGTSSWPPFA